METKYNIKETTLLLLIFLLVLLWAYTAANKLIDFASFKSQLAAQHFTKQTVNFLAWSIPSAEIIAASALLFAKTRYFGLVLSFLLMFFFTLYIAMVVFGYYDQIPCSCGGVLKQLGWQAHLWFNLFFLGISALGVYLERRLKGMVV